MLSASLSNALQRWFGAGTGCVCPTGEELLDRAHGHRPPQQPALNLVALHGGEQRRDRRGLHPLHDDAQVQPVGELNRRRDDERAGRVRVEVGDETPVDLQYVQGKLAQVAQTGQPGSVVVERDPDAEATDALRTAIISSGLVRTTFSVTSMISRPARTL